MLFNYYIELLIIFYMFPIDSSFHNSGIGFILELIFILILYYIRYL